MPEPRCRQCQNSGYVLALSKNPESHYVAPTAFRCNCQHGRQKIKTAIPVWDNRFAALYDITETFVLKTELIPPLKKTKLSQADENQIKRDAEAQSQTPKGLPDWAVLKLSQCLKHATQGIPLTVQPDFLALIKRFGKDAVASALKGLRIASSQKKAGL